MKNNYRGFIVDIMPRLVDTPNRFQIMIAKNGSLFHYPDTIARTKEDCRKVAQEHGIEIAGCGDLWKCGGMAAEL